MRKGLVLEGGGLRCLFTAGVTDVMMEAGITFDGLIGVSAGATFGCNYKSRQPGRSLRYNMRFADDPRYISWRNWWKTGNLVSAEFSYHTLPETLDIFDTDSFQKNPMEFHVVCTDILTGKPVYRKLTTGDHKELEWMRASASLPIVSRPVHVDGYQLLDGGLADSIPLKRFQEMGYERNVVILTQPKGFQKKQTRLMPLFRLWLHNYPAAVRALADRPRMYNAQLAYLEQEIRKEQTLVLAPSIELPIGRVEMDRKKMQSVYDLGRKTGEEKLDEIISFLR